MSFLPFLWISFKDSVRQIHLRQRSFTRDFFSPLKNCSREKIPECFLSVSTETRKGYVYSLILSYPSPCLLARRIKETADSARKESGPFRFILFVSFIDKQRVETGKKHLVSKQLKLIRLYLFSLTMPGKFF